MALTSDKLKELTRQRMDLIREIDKCPNDTSLMERMLCVQTELSKERHTLITNDAAPKPAVQQVAVATKVAEKTITANPIPKGKKAIKPNSTESTSDSSKKLSDFF
jgi:hypothetical protein